MMERWQRANEFIDRVEHFLIIALLSLMILIAFVQIVLRNLFATGFSWGEPLVRTLVLWVAFIGAAVAVKEGKHITIDAIFRWMPSRGRLFVEPFPQLFSCVVCGLLSYAALKFVTNEAAMGTTSFAGVPAWIPQLILPITFGVMAFRFGLHFFTNLAILRKIAAHRGQTGER